MAAVQYRVVTSTGMKTYRFFNQAFSLKRSFVERVVAYSNDLDALIKQFMDEGRTASLSPYESDTVAAVVIKAGVAYAILKG